MNIGAVLVLVALLSGCGDDGGTAAVDAAPAIDAEPGCSTTDAYTLYFNRAGGTYSVGTSDSVANTSSILNTEATVAAHNPPAGDWEATMGCLEEIFSAYAITVTDQDPGTATHIEIVVTGDDQNVLGLPNGVTSIVPNSCNLMNGSIAFVFAGALDAGDDAKVCQQAGWAAAKMFGLETVFACPDVTSVLECTGEDRTFLDQNLPCGSVDASSCMCTDVTTQNSHQLMSARAGLRCL